MIRRVYSDLPKFKTLEFGTGLNVLLAEKTAGATDKQTRNRAGKSSLLDIVHFLLGSNCDAKSIFRSEGLSGATFGMEFDLGGSFTRIERTGSRPSPVRVAGDSTAWPITPTPKDDAAYLTNDNWKLVLSKLIFGLDDMDGAWNPSFRSLISYFVRRDREGGMESPTLQWRQQATADVQVSVSFLLGLDWSVPQAWQKVRDREKSLEQIKKGMEDGTFGYVVGTAATLKSELIVAQDRVRRLRASVDSFQVVEEYHELEKEASRLTKRLSATADENVLDRRYAAELETATVAEVPPEPADLARLYREAGVVLPDLVRARFDEVRAFHESVVRNRRAYLRTEMSATLQRIADRETEGRQIDARRAEVMGVLRNAGALDQFLALQTELSKAEAGAAALKQRHEAAETLEAGTLKLKVERASLLERLRQDYAEQESVITEAVLTFREISSQLYEEGVAGSLTLEPTDNGPKFDPHIPGEKSKGVNNMRIFCFDMMLMLLGIRRGRSPGFLVHDSHLFDGVDERQVGKALALGASIAERNGFQYIVTMNTDALPRETPPGFSVEDYALDVRLTDASADGGLFGFRFD